MVVIYKLYKLTVEWNTHKLKLSKKTLENNLDFGGSKGTEMFRMDKGENYSHTSPRKGVTKESYKEISIHGTVALRKVDQHWWGKIRIAQIPGWKPKKKICDLWKGPGESIRSFIQKRMIRTDTIKLILHSEFSSSVVTIKFQWQKWPECQMEGKYLAQKSGH